MESPLIRTVSQPFSFNIFSFKLQFPFGKLSRQDFDTAFSRLFAKWSYPKRTVAYWIEDVNDIHTDIAHSFSES